VFRIPTGWTVFEIPSTPGLHEARPIGFVRLKSGGFGESAASSSSDAAGLTLRRRRKRPRRSRTAARTRDDETFARERAASARPPAPRLIRTPPEGRGRAVAMQAMDGEGDHAHAVRGDSRLLR